jgi:uncharacterized protein YegL
MLPNNKSNQQQPSSTGFYPQQQGVGNNYSPYPQQPQQQGMNQPYVKQLGDKMPNSPPPAYQQYPNQQQSYQQQNYQQQPYQQNNYQQQPNQQYPNQQQPYQQQSYQQQPYQQQPYQQQPYQQKPYQQQPYQQQNYQQYPNQQQPGVYNNNSSIPSKSNQWEQPVGSNYMAPPINNFMSSNSGGFDNNRFQQIVRKYEINQEFARKMELVRGFETVFIFDDSGSMNTELDDSPLNKPNSLMKAKRWDELQAFASTSVDILTIFDTNGCDIHFLNRPPMRNVKSYNQIEQLFKQMPGGYTPLTRTLQTVLNENRNITQQKSLLIIIVTDGQPTDDNGHIKINEFYQALATRQPIDRIFVSIVACTDDNDSISYLNNMDKQIKNLDVVDDFRNEREEVRARFGPHYPFSYGDYVVKSLIGSIDPELDALDGF